MKCLIPFLICAGFTTIGVFKQPDQAWQLLYLPAMAFGFIACAEAEGL